MTTSVNEEVTGPAPPPSPSPPRGAGLMAIVRWVIVVVAAVVAGATMWHFASAQGHGPPAGQLFHCPMHPSVVRDHPGQCPICGMTLVPLSHEGAPPAPPGAAKQPSPPDMAAVQLPPERIQLIGMKTAVVQRRPVQGQLRTVGVVEPNERGLAQATVRFSGWIQKLLVSATGERVHRGQVLATIYSPDVLHAEQELLVTSGWTGTAPGSHPHDPAVAGLEADARRRLELLGISSQEIDEVLASRKPAEAIAIRSPVDGYVISKGAVVGLAVQPGTVLFQVADLSTVWITAEVYEQDIGRVRVGQAARFEPGAYPGETHAGKVQFVYPTLDPASHALQVRIELRNRFDRSGPRLRPGLSGTVRIDSPPTTGLVVPAEAIVDTGDRRYLFVAAGGGRFEPRSVQLGRRFDDQVEVLSGVAEGDTVVMTGNFLVDSESRLRAAIEQQPQQER